MRNLLEQVAQPRSQSTTCFTFIYGLIDPRTGFVRYVGKANDPAYRLRVHLTPRELTSKSHKNHWIRELLAIGKKPEQILLEKVSQLEWQDAERRWIAYYRSIPNYPPLTNGTSGGDGIDKGTKFSEETRKKLSAIRIGRKLPPFTEEHRRKISEANKRFWENSSEEKRAKVVAQLQSKEWTEERRRAVGIKSSGTKRSSSTSRFIGVYSESGYWHVWVRANGKTNYGGRFLDEAVAAKTRDVLAIRLLGPAVRTNFPISRYSDEELSNERPKFGPAMTNTSGYKGVYWSKTAKKWVSGAKVVRGAQVHLGCFPATEEGKIEAAHAYDRWVIQHRGPDAYTNFPRDSYD